MAPIPGTSLDVMPVRAVVGKVEVWMGGGRAQVYNPCWLCRTVPTPHRSAIAVQGAAGPGDEGFPAVNRAESVPAEHGFEKTRGERRH